MFRFTKWVFTILLVLILSLVAARETRADEIIFSNFGPGMTFNPNTSWNVSGIYYGGRVVAQSFTPSANFAFSNAKLPMGILYGPNILQVVLMTSSGPSQYPGLIIETVTITNAVPPIQLPGIIVANSALHPMLNAGVQYWIVAYAPDDNTFMGWNLSHNDSSSYVLLNGFHSLTGPWPELGSLRSAFQIEGNGLQSTVPEPATLLLLSPVLVVVAWRVHRRKTGKNEIA